VIELVGVEPVHERGLFVAEIPSLGDWPETIEQPQPHFAAFVAADVSSAGDGELTRFARRLLAQGAVYVSVWGPGCERLHDVVDAERDGRAAPLVMTSWHAHETLDEALWFALFASVPDEAYFETCDADLAIVVGDPTWAAHVRGRLGNPAALYRSGLEQS
jgi:hypothetical protein